MPIPLAGPPYAPQKPPIGGPGPQFTPPPVNIAQILGQLSSTPPVGPLPITPYAPADVGTLAMPGAGLAGAQTAIPPWRGGLPQRQPFGFGGGSVGGMMQPTMRVQGGRDDRQQMVPMPGINRPFGPEIGAPQSLQQLIQAGMGPGRW